MNFCFLFLCILGITDGSFVTNFVDTFDSNVFYWNFVCYQFCDVFIPHMNYEVQF